MAGFNFVHWHSLRLVIHAPIPPVGEGKDDVKQTMDKAYRAVMGSLPEKYQGYVKNDDQ